HGGATREVISLVNAPNFAKQSEPGDTINSSPCAASAIDVKVTETNVPWYFKLLNVGFIDAQARVAIEQQRQATGEEPLARPSPAPPQAGGDVDQRAPRRPAAPAGQPHAG